MNHPGNDKEIQARSFIVNDPWRSLRAFTDARIALGRTGTALPLSEVLSFRLAHAHARDAVYSALDIPYLMQQGWTMHLLHSQAADREEYLQRPDKGRQLDDRSAASLLRVDADLVIILADGLSATAINRHAIPLLELLYPMLSAKGVRIAPVQLVQQARVAIGDAIGALLGVQLSLVLIGERPGLSSPDSLGAYLTYQPRPGMTDESRNCISNIRPEGLSYRVAAEKLVYLVDEALRLRLTGVGLKDNYIPSLSNTPPFNI